MSDKGIEGDSPFAEPQLGRRLKEDNSAHFTSRFYFKTDSEERGRLEKLCQRMGFDSNSTVIRDALRVYDLITKQVIVKGDDLLIRDQRRAELERISFFRQQKRSAA